MAAEKSSTPNDLPFVNEVRLNARQWALTIAILAAVMVLTPRVWKRLERVDAGPGSRIPYALSRDYWLYEHRLERTLPDRVILLGDSVIWGEYVQADGTLSRFLDDQERVQGRFVNAGVNGLFPLAMEGLARAAAGPLQHRKIILHCNVLWMTSPKADLQTDKEERFNHADLVPQFSPRIPCYKADLSQRLGIVIGRHSGFLSWVGHLQVAYFGQKDILAWTLEEDAADPPRRPNAYRNPLRQVTLNVPAEPAVDPERGPRSPRHKPWSTTGVGATRFEWVDPDRSMQWAAFQRTVKFLEARGNDVFVVVGPFNEHIMAPENRAAFQRWQAAIRDWLEANRIPSAEPEVLPSALYADASHPLTEGYQLLAARLHEDPNFQKWMRSGR